MTTQERDDVLAVFRQAMYNPDKARQIMGRQDLTPVQCRIVMGKLTTLFQELSDANPGIGVTQALEQTIRFTVSKMPRYVAKTARKK